MRIYELLRHKGFAVITARPSATVLEVINLLKEYNLGAVVVSPDGRGSPASSPSGTSSARWPTGPSS